MARHEAGWRSFLTGVLVEGTTRGVWDVPVGAAATTELVIAAVKGVRLAPEAAAQVFGQLEALLVGRVPDDTEGERL
jgi:hypothetical protein